MNAPSTIYILRWLIRDTFRQALASKVFWIMLSISVLVTVFCLGIGFEGGGEIRFADDPFVSDPVTKEPLTEPTPNLGRVSLLFGFFRVQMFRDVRTEVELLYVTLGTWVAGAASLLLALVFTAGFLPEALQPGSAAVLFAKPTPRWLYVVGKYIGVVIFVAFQAAVFFVATWLALGVRSGVWDVAYLSGIPILVVHFAGIYCFSVLLAVCTRSTVACLLGSVLFWFVCAGMNYARHASLALPQLAGKEYTLSPVSSAIVEAGYWMLPKPADMIVILEGALQAEKHKTTLSSAFWSPSPLQVFVEKADLIVTGKISEVESDAFNKEGKKYDLAVLDISDLVKAQGVGTPKAVKIGQTAGGKSALHFKAGQEGIWLLRKDVSRDIYWVKHPLQFQDIARQAELTELVAGRQRHFDPALSVLTTILFTIVMLTIAGMHIGKVDY